jgi:hypothetical protein
MIGGRVSPYGETSNHNLVFVYEVVAGRFYHHADGHEQKVKINL